MKRVMRRVVAGSVCETGDVAGRRRRCALAEIQCKYLKRYPINLPHDEEPTPEWLAAVDDDVPDEEQLEPDADVLNEDELAAALQKLEERQTMLTFRKAVSPVVTCLI